MSRALFSLRQRVHEHHPRRSVTAAVVALGIALPVAACGTERSPAEPTSDLGPAARFTEFELFHVGRRFGADALTIDGSADLRRWRPRRPIHFGYGFCDAPAGEGDCNPPVVIRNVLSCADNLSRRGRTTRPNRLLRVRGVRAGLFSTQGDDPNLLMLTTGVTTVVVSGASSMEVIAVAKRLRSTDGTIGPADDLKPPNRRWLRRGCRYWRSDSNRAER